VFGRPSPTAARPWQLAQSSDAPLRSSATAGIRADGADTSWCALRGATVVGIRHRLVGAPGQDAWAWAGDGDRVVLAVADGLGAFASSGDVASMVAAVAVEAARRGEAAPAVEADQWLVAAVAAANEAAAMANEATAMANEAAAGGGVVVPGDAGAGGPADAADRQQGASTLVLAVIGRDGAADVVRVGDSTAFHLAGGVWTELFVDAEALSGDEVHSPVTAALPSPAPEIQAVSVVLSPGEAVVLVSDGVGDPLRDGPTTVAPGLAEALSAPPHPLVLAAQADFSRQGCQDDRTIVGVWLVAPEEPVAPEE
jgi:serine/threonine protein phosphatase PrpC